MRDNLIAFIKAFQTKQDGVSGRNEVTLGCVGEITLTFGYGYHDADKVIVWWFKFENRNGVPEPIEDRMEELSVEDAVDAFLKMYGLD